MKTWKFAILMLLAVLAFASLMWFVHLNHVRHCDVCNNAHHVDVCSKLDRNQKAEFDRAEGCDWFWCSHYNGR